MRAIFLFCDKEMEKEQNDINYETDLQCIPCVGDRVNISNDIGNFLFNFTAGECCFFTRQAVVRSLEWTIGRGDTSVVIFCDLVWHKHTVAEMKAFLGQWPQP